MSAARIYVVVSSDDLNAKYRAEALARDPERKPNPIVFECNADGSATLEQTQKRAADFERSGYGACRVGRVVFDDHPAFHEVPGLCGEGDCHYFGQKAPSSCACGRGKP